MASVSEAPKFRPAAKADEPEAEVRPVLVPGGNKAPTSPATLVKPVPKSSTKGPGNCTKAGESGPKSGGKKPSVAGSNSTRLPVSKVLDAAPKMNLSMNASCSSDVSMQSFRSRASTGRIGRPVVGSRASGLKKKAVATVDIAAAENGPLVAPELSLIRTKCTWVTPNTDPCYVTFHDEEWGVPVHEDQRLFELLVLSGALAELSWPEILNKRHTFREIFMDFDPVAVSKLNEKKLLAPGSSASSLMSEQRTRTVIENAHQVIKIVEEFGSFDRYCWSFVGYKPIIGRFTYQRQVPAKSPKAEAFSKDMIRRGFRSVTPTIIYSFMQAAGLTNDHLLRCSRFEECAALATAPPNSGKNSQTPGNGGSEGQLVKRGFLDAIDAANIS